MLTLEVLYNLLLFLRPAAATAAFLPLIQLLLENKVVPFLFPLAHSRHSLCSDSIAAQHHSPEGESKKRATAFSFSYYTRQGSANVLLWEGSNRISSRRFEVLDYFKTARREQRRIQEKSSWPSSDTMHASLKASNRRRMRAHSVPRRRRRETIV